MAYYPIPNTDEWFRLLREFNPEQAEMTQLVLERTGRPDVCSVCGDRPASDYEVIREDLHVNAVATIRLCADCLTIRRSVHGETLEPLSRPSP